MTDPRPPRWLSTALEPGGIAGLAFALLLVAATTVGIALTNQVVDLGRIGVIYMLPVLVAALRWGLTAALIAALASVGASAFFFYPPIFSFQVHDWEQLVDLLVFTVVAVVMSQLAFSLRRQAAIADRAIGEARMRAETDQLREALIGSVSHELRTPLASILGAATVLSSAPAVTAEPRLASLAAVARDEAERLNNDIQNLLDATRISSAGLEARRQWADPADIVNAALERRRARLAQHRLDVTIADDLPFLYVDQALIQQALGQLLDNAAKYSSAGSIIALTGRRDGAAVVLSVGDQGSGVPADELARLGERFFRGSRHAATTGSGLGLWIAKAFVSANDGRLTVVNSAGGLTVSLRLPVPDSAAGALPHE
jgi:K+-sensing histidine kinase KdpD